MKQKTKQIKIPKSLIAKLLKKREELLQNSVVLEETSKIVKESTGYEEAISEKEIANLICVFSMYQKIIKNIFSSNTKGHQEHRFFKEIEKIVSKYHWDTLDFSTQEIEYLQRKKESSKNSTNFMKDFFQEYTHEFDKEEAKAKGVWYTPQEIVDFMIESTDVLLQQEFGVNIGTEQVKIIEPFAGTGGFITSILDYIAKVYPDSLEQKYKDIYGQELMVVPFFLMILNVEYTYHELTGMWRTFKNASLVDTFTTYKTAFDGGGNGDSKKQLELM